MLPSEPYRPRCKLLGGESDKNIVISKVAEALKRAGKPEESGEFFRNALKTNTYGQMIRMAMAYVEVV